MIEGTIPVDVVSDATALAVIIEKLTAETITPETVTTGLLPVTETYPETLTSPVTVNVVFPE